MSISKYMHVIPVWYAGIKRKLWHDEGKKTP